MWRPQRCGGRAAERAALASPFDAFCGGACALLVNFGPLFPPTLQIFRLITRQNYVVDVVRVSVITTAVESVQ